MNKLQSYPAMKDSGVEWLGRVPEHWEVRRLKQAFSRIVGGSTPSSADTVNWDGDVVWVTPADISKTTRLKKSLRRITEDGLRSCSSELVPPGSIVVTSRAPVGNVAIAETNLCTNQGCKALVATPNVVEPLFGLNVLATLKGELQSLAVGTTFTEISTSRMGSIVMPLPPIPEQAAIVRYLDHVDRRVQRLVRAKRKLIALLTEEKQAIIHRAVTRGLDPDVPLKDSGVEWLGKVPAHWEVRRLKNICPEITVGVVVNPSSYFSDHGIPILLGNNVRAGRFLLKGVRRIDDESNLKLSKSQLREGDVVVVRVGAPGVAAVVSQDLDGCNCASMMIVRRAAVADPLWIEHLFNSPVMRIQIDMVKYGAAQKQFNIGHAVEFLAPIPPIGEQRTILRHVAEVMVNFDAALERAEREIELLNEYRTRLIADVVTGKLDVRRAAAALPEVDPLDTEDAPDNALDTGADEELEDRDAILKEAASE